MVNIYHAARTCAGLVIMDLHPSEKSNARAFLKGQDTIFVLEHDDAFTGSLNSCLRVFIPVEGYLIHVSFLRFSAIIYLLVFLH